MPVHRTTKTVKGVVKPAFQWGDRGKKYTYTPHSKQSAARAKAKAYRQERAARSNGYQGP